MNHRHAKHRGLLRSRPRPLLRPAVEGLEGRALMSYGGSPVLTYGTGGYALLPGPGGSSSINIIAEASAPQADGKTVVAEYYNTNPFGGFGGTQAVTVARYNLDGTPDATFGTAGFFRDASLTVDGSTIIAVSTANAIAIQPDGKILASATVNNAVKVFRLDAVGALDASFGTGGFVTLGNTAGTDGKLDHVAALAVRPDGTIAVGGAVGASPFQAGYIPAVAVLSADGALDTLFGTGGLAKVPLPAGRVSFVGVGGQFNSPGGMAVYSDGKIVLASAASTGAAGSAGVVEGVATRFTVAGALDTTFGTGGQAIVTGQSLVGFGDVMFAGVAIQPDSKVVLGGGFHTPSGYNSALAVRLNADGTNDTSFGIGGADIAANTLQEIGGVALAPDGKIFLSDAINARLLRLDANGLPDLTFGTLGVVSPPRPLSNFSSGIAGIGFLPNGQISVVVSGPGNSLDHLLDHGATGDYDGDGISDPAAYDTTTATFVDVPSAGGTAASTPIGDPGVGLSLPVPGAYDGNGVSEVAVYRVGLGAFDVKPAGGGADVLTPFGEPGFGNAIPAPGDFDRSGRTELGVYVPRLGAYFYRSAFGGYDRIVLIGTAGAGQAIPAPADYFGTGQDDVAVYSVADGAFLIRNPVTAEILAVPFGTPGPGASIPAPGDYDGSGHAELAVYLPASGTLVYRPAAGGPDVSIAVGLPGVAQSLPAAGDYAGLGHAEAAVYEPSVGTLFHVPSPGGPVISAQVGVAGESIPFSTGPEAVAVSGVGPSGSPGVRAASVEVPLTSDVLDTLAGTAPKKKAGHA